MSDIPMPHRRILLVAESVTLAHFARCATVAQALDPESFEVVFASDPRYLRLLPESRPFAFRPIHSIPSAQFTNALSKGRAVYDTKTLTGYVEEDLALLDAVRPDLVIGDFRLSLAVSAPARGIAYAAMINVYWSPYARIRYPVPDLPFVRLLGVRASQHVFDIVRPIAFAMHAAPLNRVRRDYGLPSLGADLRNVYSWADHVLYPDIGEGIDMAPLPPNHHFVGPVLWSTHSELPDWWENLPNDSPIVYVTLGSSGDPRLLPKVLDALAQLPVTVIATTGGSVNITRPPPNAYLAEFLPGDNATARAALLICNGGNLTTYQAMSCGVPIIGIATNMDQLLNMQMVERMGVGKTLRGAHFTEPQLCDTVRYMLNNGDVAEATARVARQLRPEETVRRINQVVRGILR